MFTVEQANLVAARTMGSNRYMATVLQQNRGCGDGDDTDMRDCERFDSALIPVRYSNLST